MVQAIKLGDGLLCSDTQQVFVLEVKFCSNKDPSSPKNIEFRIGRAQRGSTLRNLFGEA